MKAFSGNEVVACVFGDTPSQKAELESLEQQRGGVDRESAMLAEEVLPLQMSCAIRLRSGFDFAIRFCASRLKLDSAPNRLDIKTHNW